MSKINPLYSKFKFDGQKWSYFYICKDCKNKITVSANKPYYLARNLKKKKICKLCSLDKQKGVDNPFYGKKHSNKSKSKISSAKTGIKTSDHMSDPYYREMLRKMKRELWDSGKMEHVRVKMGNLMKQRIANGELKSFNRSKAEDEIVKLLNKMGISSTISFKIESKIFDIYIPEFNLLIEYNGDYWHCNPKKYSSEYLNKKKSMTAKQIWEKDKNKLDLAIKNGYNVEVIWEQDYKNNPKIIENLLKNYDTKNK